MVESRAQEHRQRLLCSCLRHGESWAKGRAGINNVTIPYRVRSDYRNTIHISFALSLVDAPAELESGKHAVRLVSQLQEKRGEL